MPRQAAFLRAINVGDRRVTNVQLAAAVETCGYTDVGTFLASGNVLYDPGGNDVHTATSALEAAFETHLGFATEVFVRTAEDLDAILQASPFADVEVVAPAKPQVAFLRAPLAAADAEAVEALGTDVDRLAVIGSELHWLPTAGLGRTVLDLKSVATRIGPMTVRTLNTVARLRAKLD